MNDTPPPAGPAPSEPDPPAAPATPAQAAAATVPPAAPVAQRLAAAVGPAPVGVVWLAAAVLAGSLSVASITMAVLGQQKVKALEQELVRRQQDSQAQAIEARAMARQAQDLAQAADVKVSQLEGRVTEATLYRSQLEELMQQLSRSRDENVLADVDAAVRVALQQSALTGSAEPLTAALRQAEERLARMNQPRVERVRRAVARDLDRVRAAAVVDIPTLVMRLDEVMRAVDDLPLLAEANGRSSAGRPQAAVPAGTAARAGAAASAAVPAAPDSLWSWWPWLQSRAAWVSGRVWDEVRSLLRVTRVDNADAALVAPEQAWFLRENLKLRVLNARLALLSRQFDTAQSDLREVQGMLDRYFDRNAKRVQLTAELVRQASSQSRTVSLPRPDETLAALAAAQAGR